MSSNKEISGMPVAGKVICGLLAAGSVVGHVDIGQPATTAKLSAAVRAQMRNLLDAAAPEMADEEYTPPEEEEEEYTPPEEEEEEYTPPEEEEEEEYTPPEEEEYTPPEEEEEEYTPPEEEEEYTPPEEEEEEDTPPEEVMEEEPMEEPPAMDAPATGAFPPTPSGTAPPPDLAALAALDPPYIVGADVEVAPPFPGVTDISGINVPTATDCAAACSAIPECNAASWLGANTAFTNPSNCFLKEVLPGCIVPPNAEAFPMTYLLIQTPADVCPADGTAAMPGAFDAGMPMAAPGAGGTGGLAPMEAPPVEPAATAPLPGTTGALPTDGTTTNPTATDGTTDAGAAGTTTDSAVAETGTNGAAVTGAAAFAAIAFGAVLAL